MQAWDPAENQRSYRRIEDYPVASTKSSLILFALLMTGCTSFDQTDDGNSKEVLLGKTFTISLPSVAEPRESHIAKQSVARFVGSQRVFPGGMETFEFKAIALGETEIRIPLEIQSSESKDFVLTIRVVLGGSPY